MNDASPSGLRFTPRQSALVSSALAALALLVLVSLGVTLLWGSLRFVSAHATVLLPPVAAVILAQVVQPVFDAVRRGLLRLLPVRKRANPGRTARGLIAAGAILLTLLVVFLPVIAFFWYFGTLVANQLSGLFERVPDAVAWAWGRVPDLRAWLDERGLGPVVDRLDPVSWFDPAALAGTVRDRALVVAGGVPAFFGSVSAWLVTPVYLAIYLGSRTFGGQDLANVMLGFSDRTRANVRFLVDEFIRLVVSFFRGQVVVALIEGALFGLGFQFLAGLPYGLTLGLLVGLVNIIPYMGSIFVMPFVGLFAFFGAGGWTTLLLVLLVWGAVGLADFYITPAVVGDRTGLGPFAVIFSLLFWGEVIGGFVGLFLAVPLSAFVAVCFRLVAREYFPGFSASPGLPPPSAPPPAPDAPATPAPPSAAS